jgi:hypothetical protein
MIWEIKMFIETFIDNLLASLLVMIIFAVIIGLCVLFAAHPGWGMLAVLLVATAGEALAELML